MEPATGASGPVTGVSDLYGARGGPLVRYLRDPYVPEGPTSTVSSLDLSQSAVETEWRDTDTPCSPTRISSFPPSRPIFGSPGLFQPARNALCSVFRKDVFRNLLCPWTPMTRVHHTKWSSWSACSFALSSTDEKLRKCEGRCT